MKFKTKNYSKHLSVYILLVLCSFMTFTSCSNDVDDVIVTTPEANELSKSLYFYGSESEFEKFQDVEMTHITSVSALESISTTQQGSYALFVGKDIDVRSGLIDNLRNSGVLVTQLEGEVVVPKEFSTQIALINEETLSSEESGSGVVDTSLEEDEFLLTTYFTVNREREILGSIFESTSEAVSYILEWSDKKSEETREAFTTEKTSSKVRRKAMGWGFTWGGLANFAIRTEIFEAQTPNYIIDQQEYPTMFIYDHVVSVISTNSSYKVDNLQIIQNPISASGLRTSLREFYPLNGDNGVLDGRTGSDSYGYGFGTNGNIGADGFSSGVSTSHDWSHTTDWSIPACQVRTYHDVSQNKFHVMYDVDTSGSWSGQSVSAENYTYYAYHNANSVSPTQGYYEDIPITYYYSLHNPSAGSDGYRDLLVQLNSNSIMTITLYHRGYFGTGRSTTAPSLTW
ncbi:MAG: hypothetical protein AAF617_07845 [Bacteroidota bacterium]